jgi:hypothetical protein
VLEFLPFNEELNRLQLVIRNGAAAQFRVTWGSQTKAFTAAQLERGINLAAEFQDNPFSAPFAKVDNVVRTQQNFEPPQTNGQTPGQLDALLSIGKKNATA